MDSEVTRQLSLLKNKGALTNGVPVSETFNNTTDSMEAIEDDLLVPSADSATNTRARDVIGNKTDAAVSVASTTASAIAYLKRLITNSIIATGTFTTSSATVPADTGRTEANDYWRGSWLLPLTGAVALQPRLIVGFANAGGVFTLDAENPLTAAPGLVTYAILPPVFPLQPAADATTNTTTPHTVGNKADTASYSRNSANSLMRYLKGLHTIEIVANGTFTTSSTTVPADTGRAEANDYWNGSWIIPLTGSVALQPRLIVDFANAGGVFTLDSDQPFSAAPGLVTYVIVSPNSQLVPAADSTSNQTPAHVIGNKTDASSSGATASLIARIKELRDREVPTETGATFTFTVAMGTTETDVIELSPGTTILEIMSLYMDFVNVQGDANTPTATVRKYEKVDDATYRRVDSITVAPSSDPAVEFKSWTTGRDTKITVQMSTALNANAGIPHYRVVRTVA
ncbi:hypothetical protein HYS94_01500 [Candidatus Daviesbacteria bacterium]|nr:hypothetical protein [Candidatus Daviesbacteria bacterium]